LNVNVGLNSVPAGKEPERDCGRCRSPFFAVKARKFGMDRIPKLLYYFNIHGCPCFGMLQLQVFAGG
jgi:hypothetical protein